MQSVSDNIMLGQLCPIGTGSFTLLLDERRLLDAIDVSAGFMYGDADIEGRGGLTPGTLCCSLSDFARGVACQSAAARVIQSVKQFDCPAPRRPHSICNARPSLTVPDVFSWCHVTILKQCHVFAGWERDIFTVRSVAWLLTNKSRLLADEPRILSHQPRVFSYKPWLLAN